jgi:hypothetical protein
MCRQAGVEITDEMIEAGVDALLFGGAWRYALPYECDNGDRRGMVRAIYRAMTDSRPENP